MSLNKLKLKAENDDNESCILTSPRPQYHANQQLQKKKRPSSGGAHLETGHFSKKRRVMHDDRHPVYENHIPQPIALPGCGQEFSDIFKRGER